MGSNINIFSQCFTSQQLAPCSACILKSLLNRGNNPYIPLATPGKQRLATEAGQVAGLLLHPSIPLIWQISEPQFRQTTGNEFPSSPHGEQCQKIWAARAEWQHTYLGTLSVDNGLCVGPTNCAPAANAGKVSSPLRVLLRPPGPPLGSSCWCSLQRSSQWGNAPPPGSGCRSARKERKIFSSPCMWILGSLPHTADRHQHTHTKTRCTPEKGRIAICCSRQDTASQNTIFSKLFTLKTC